MKTSNSFYCLCFIEFQTNGQTYKLIHDTSPLIMWPIQAIVCNQHPLQV